MKISTFSAAASLAALFAAGAACTAKTSDAAVNPQAAAKTGVAETTDAAAAKKEARALRTEKTGAALEFSHQQSGAADARRGSIAFAIREGYEGGLLRVSARASAGLELSPAAPAATFPLDGAAPLRWDVFYSAAADGIYYVDLVASVEQDGETVAVSTHSARVKIGAAEAPAAKANGEVTTTPDGEAVVSMPAEENDKD